MGAEQSLARRAAWPTAWLAGIVTAGTVGYAVHGSEIPGTFAAADTSQFIPPNCDTMPNVNGWEKPLCQKMAMLGRNILAAYNDGDVRENDAYQWSSTVSSDGFSLGVLGELPGSYGARYHRTSMGVQLVEVQQTVQMAGGFRQKYEVETEPNPQLPSEGQLHFTVTKLDPDQSKLPAFLYDSHTQANDVTITNNLVQQIMPIVAQNGIFTVQ